MAFCPISVAPMMKVTTPAFRLLLRLQSRRILLYTEMVSCRGQLDSPTAFSEMQTKLIFDPLEAPVVVQLGGNDPKILAAYARMAEEMGYCAVNLNVGCPSPAVRDGMFGAGLMKHPKRVAECVKAMKAATTLPVSVKHRLGVDDMDSYEELHHFVSTVAEAGCEWFIVHARKVTIISLFLSFSLCLCLCVCVCVCVCLSCIVD